MNREALRQRAQELISSGEDAELGQAILDLVEKVDGGESYLAQGKRSALTARQRQVLVIVLAHKRKHGTSPSIREMKQVLGINSTNGVHDHYKALERKSYITRVPFIARSIRLRAPDGTLF